MNFKKAILSLPKIDKRWSVSLGNPPYLFFDKGLGKFLYLSDNTIEEFHAAAKSIGMEIDYEVWCEGPGKSVYYPAVYDNGILVWGGRHEYRFTDLTKMFRAAFISAVEYRLKEIVK